MTDELKAALRTQLADLSIHWYKSVSSPKFELAEESVDAILDLLQPEIERLVLEARLDENAWSRQQLIIEQLYNAPNSGYGRMIKWGIWILNKRKLDLLTQLNKKEGE